MSFRSICSVLALTASQSAAEGQSLAELLNSQNEAVPASENAYFAGHPYPKSDYRDTDVAHHPGYHRYSYSDYRDTDYGIGPTHGAYYTGPRPSYYDRQNDLKFDGFTNTQSQDYKEHFNESGLVNEPMPENGECPAGFTRIGCCKCILGHNANDKNMADEGSKQDSMPVIHGASNDSEPQGSATTSEDSEEHDEPEPEKKEKKQTAKDEPARKSKFTMSTSEEQAKSKRQIDTERKQREQDEKRKSQEEKKPERKPETKPEDDPEKQKLCPVGFKYVEKDLHHGDGKIAACRLPMSYDLGSGVEHHCVDCHYSYGRWLEPCAHNFVRNGCCTCTPHCPEGYVLDYWEQRDILKNNYVCLLPITLSPHN